MRAPTTLLAATPLLVTAALGAAACSKHPATSSGGAGGAGGEGGATSSSSATSSSTSASSSASSATSASSGAPGDPYAQYRQDCVDKINALRATKGLAPYQRWTDAESCVDQQATSDSMTMQAHGAFINGTPSCGGYAQNECPGWGASAITGCLDAMWAEKDQDGCQGCDACDTFDIFNGNCQNCIFNGSVVCGHYVNMSSKTFTMAACGFSKDGSWAAINFQ